MNHPAADQTAAKLSKNFPQGDRREIAKYECLDGKVIAKPASNRWHNIISTNFAIAVGSRIQRANFELYTNDMKVRLDAESICYPDFVVASSDPAFVDSRSDVLDNPIVIVEIFSSLAKSTERHRKLEGFLAVPSMKECLLVNENEMRVEHYARQNAKQWIYRIYNERDDVIGLESINCKISLAEVYSQVKFRESELSSRAVN